MTPTQERDEVSRRLTMSRTLLERGDSGLHAQCGAWLMRIALERAVGAVGRAHHGGSRSMRALLLTLPKYVDADVARAAADLWYSLCRVAHHQDYELIPTVDELRAWQARSVQVADALLRSLTADHVARHPEE